MGVGYQHEGEEFIYALAGKIELTIGDHVNTLNEGESLHFNSGIKAQVKEHRRGKSRASGCNLRTVILFLRD